MAVMSATRISQSRSLNIYDYRCEIGLGAKPFVERHGRASISFVRKGSFGYRTRGFRAGRRIGAGRAVGR
jgi:hypothetical protein